MIMIGALLLLIASLSPTQQQRAPISPCPHVFLYDEKINEPGRWYGKIKLQTESTLNTLLLNIILDSKADLLGNWAGEVTTKDNMYFKIENNKLKVHPGPPLEIQFFVQYNPLSKAPLLKAILLNSREICNADAPQPAVDRVDTIAPNPQLIRSRPEHIPDNPRPIDNTKEDPAMEGPVYVPNPTPEQIEPYRIDNGPPPAQSVTERQPQRRPHKVTTTTSTTSRPNTPDDDYDDSNGKLKYFTGGQLFINLDDEKDGKKPTNQCGQVLRYNANPLVLNGKPTAEGQWPWQVAIYQTEVVDSKYKCGGTLVSHKHIITAAHCVTYSRSRRPVNPNTLTIILGKHNLRTSVEGVELRLVSDIIIHPEYNASSFSRDASILKMRSAVEYSEFIQPACLWPEDQIDLINIIGKNGSVVGWGFDDTGIATEELTLAEMLIVDTDTCIRSHGIFFVRYTSDYTYCAGYRDGTSVCNGDSGGGMVFYMRNSWYLRGLVSLSVRRNDEYQCDPRHFVVFTDLAKMLPWIQQYISKDL